MAAETKMLRNRQVFEDGFRPSPADADADEDDDGDDACGPFLLSLLSSEGEGEPTGGWVSAAIAQGAGRAAQIALKRPPQDRRNSDKHTACRESCSEAAILQALVCGTLPCFFDHTGGVAYYCVSRMTMVSPAYFI